MPCNSRGKADGGRKGREEAALNAAAEQIPTTARRRCVHCLRGTDVATHIRRPVCAQCRAIESGLNPRTANPIMVRVPDPPAPPLPERETRVWTARPKLAKPKPRPAGRVTGKGRGANKRPWRLWTAEEDAFIMKPGNARDVAAAIGRTRDAVWLRRRVLRQANSGHPDGPN